MLPRSIRILITVCSACAGLSILFASLALIFPSEVMGANRWIKPLKFCVSILIFLGTIAWIFILTGSALSEKQRTRYAILFSFFLLFEIAAIALQAARGVRSHFNHDTATDDAIYSLMGVMILANTVLFAVMLARLWNANVDAAVRLAVRAGGVFFLLGSLAGGMMSGIDRHSIGGADGGPGLPGLNWSTAHGDVRALHFLLLHGMQFLLIASVVFPGLPAARLQTTRAAAVIYAAACAYTALRTFQGLPVL